VARLRLFGAAIATSLVGAFTCPSFAADLSTRAQVTSRPDLLEPETAVRRVCVQMGVQTFPAPDKGARIAKGNAALPARLAELRKGTPPFLRAWGEVSMFRSPVDAKTATCR